jgi:flagellar hook-length control protein FliK
MISPLDFISYDHRPADFVSQGTELEGPPFGEYLARAEKDRGGTSAQHETDRTENDSDSKVLKNAEDTKKTESADDTAASTENRKTDSPDDAEKVNKDSGEGPDKTVDSKKREAQNSAVPVRTEENEHKRDSQKTGLKVESAGNNRTAARKLNMDDESDTKLQAGSGTETGKNSEKADISKKSDEAANSEETTKENPAVKIANLSGEGLVAPGNTEKGKSEGNQPAERSRNTDDASSDSYAVGRRHTGGETERQTARAEIIDLRSRKETKNEQTVSQASQKFDGVNIQESLKTEGQNRQDFVVIEAAQGKTDGNISRSEAGPAQAAVDLSRALKEEGNGEIIKKAQFVLKDRDQGEIRLILKPEKLGEVRIRLNLSDNRHIAGRIIVENNSVREVFQENMEALNRAFRENGFQTAGLDVSVGERGGFSGRRREKNIEGLPVEKMTRIFDDQIPRVEETIFGESRVNVYV